MRIEGGDGVIEGGERRDRYIGTEGGETGTEG